MAFRMVVPLLSSVIACFLFSGCDDSGSHKANSRHSARVVSELAAIKSRIEAIETRNGVILRRLKQVEKRLAAAVGLHLALEQVVAENSRRERLTRQALRRQLEPLTRDILEDRSRLDQLEARLDRLGSKIRRMQESASERQHREREGLCDRCPEGMKKLATCSPSWKSGQLSERIVQLRKAVFDVDDRLRKSQAVVDAKLLLLASELRRLRSLLRSLRYGN